MPKQERSASPIDRPTLPLSRPGRERDGQIECYRRNPMTHLHRLHRAGSMSENWLDATGCR